MGIKGRKGTDGVTLEEMYAQLSLVVGDEHKLIEFCAARNVDKLEVQDFYREVKLRLENKAPVLVDKKTFKSLQRWQANPQKAISHFGKKQQAKAAKKAQTMWEQFDKAVATK